MAKTRPLLLICLVAFCSFLPPKTFARNSALGEIAQTIPEAFRKQAVPLSRIIPSWNVLTQQSPPITTVRGKPIVLAPNFVGGRLLTLKGFFSSIAGQQISTIVSEETNIALPAETSIAVIGSGPETTYSANRLAKSGCKVTIYEEHSGPGAGLPYLFRLDDRKKSPLPPSMTPFLDDYSYLDDLTLAGLQCSPSMPLKFIECLLPPALQQRAVAKGFSHSQFPHTEKTATCYTPTPQKENPDIKRVPYAFKSLEEITETKEDIVFVLPTSIAAHTLAKVLPKNWKLRYVMEYYSVVHEKAFADIFGATKLSGRALFVSLTGPCSHWALPFTNPRGEKVIYFGGEIRKMKKYATKPPEGEAKELSLMPLATALSYMGGEFGYWFVE